MSNMYPYGKSVVQAVADIGTKGIVKDYIADSTSVNKSYGEYMRSFTIINDDATNSLTFTIGSFTIVVKAGESFDEAFPPFNAITINATGTFRALVRGEE